MHGTLDIYRRHYMTKHMPRYFATAAATLAASLLVTGPASERPASSATTAQGGVFARVQTPVSDPYVNIAPHQEKKASVSCRPGTRVTGGGGSGPGIVYLTDSAHREQRNAHWR